MIGVDPHKASHTAVAISAAEEPLGELRVSACAAQAGRLLAWAAAWPQRTWAVEGAGGLGHLLARQLLAAGERVLDVPPRLGARVRLLAAGDTNKNDPDDARPVAVAALRSAGVREVRAFLDDLRRIDAQVRETRKTPATAVQAAGTCLTRLFGVGPVIAAAVIGDVRDVSRFGSRDHFAACNGTAPIEVSSGPRKTCRLSRRGNRRLNHAIHMAAVTQIRHRHSDGRACYDKKLAESKTPKEALRSLKRQISNAIFACLQADAARAAARAEGPGGQQGNDSAASAAGSHPRHRLFGQATPGPGHHPTAAAGNTAPSPARARGGAGHSSIAATLPPAPPRVQVERPQRSEDERPAGAARRRPHSAARKATGQGSLRKPQRPKGTSQAAKNTGGAP